jgi:hypothetical protein
MALVAQASSNSAMNSDPPSIWMALTGHGISAVTLSRKSAAIYSINPSHICLSQVTRFSAAGRP